MPWQVESPGNPLEDLVVVFTRPHRARQLMIALIPQEHLRGDTKEGAARKLLEILILKVLGG